MKGEPGHRDIEDESGVAGQRSAKMSRGARHRSRRMSGTPASVRLHVDGGHMPTQFVQRSLGVYDYCGLPDTMREHRSHGPSLSIRKGGKRGCIGGFLSGSAMPQQAWPAPFKRPAEHRPPNMRGAAPRPAGLREDMTLEHLRADTAPDQPQGGHGSRSGSGGHCFRSASERTLLPIRLGRTPLPLSQSVQNGRSPGHTAGTGNSPIWASAFFTSSTCSLWFASFPAKYASYADMSK